MTSSNGWVYLIGVILTSGLAKYGIDLLREARARKKAAPPPSKGRQREIDASLVTMARINEELEADNTRLRDTLASALAQVNDMIAQLTRERESHNTELSREREDRRAERETFQAEVSQLEARIRSMRDEHESQYGALAEEVKRLRESHGDTGKTTSTNPRRH